ncbi:hypothetical protein PFICI_03326 [Pestalotiopsis fici W106-1]|uniref:HEAT repeat domain-containing protein n=1 Tax=Pestalotiopsis fici (strain W106-1 / CGMCC3.15140) TaxID=1229662 RepID=W3XJC0_PESFW|nr:uncharacterized protein PFICI_03326 [Pestalotiopsis fici W106-1]ETS85301.1 hypothetical protein PFICI_03326 [Pestalotiopsis fici W106-1]
MTTQADAQDPLAGLGEINWSNLEHAYGSAEDIPPLVRKLKSSDKEDITSAYGVLYTSIFHQGSRYSASSAVVPFLYRLAICPETLCRENIVRLLTRLAIGEPTHHWLRGIDVKGWREDVATFQATGWCEEEKTRRLEWINEGADEDDRKRRKLRSILFPSPEEIVKSSVAELGVYDAVKDGLQHIIDLLNDDSVAIRQEAAYALAWFPEELERIHPALFNLIDSETNPVVQATGLIALGQLQTRSEGGIDDTPVVRCLNSVFAQGRGSGLSRWASAIALIMLHVSQPEHVNEVLRKLKENDYLQEYEPWNLEDVNFEFADPDLASLATMSLRNLTRANSQGSEMVIIEIIPASRGETTLVLAEIGLKLVFETPASEPLTPEGLIHDQRELIRALTKVDSFNWSFANFLSILSGWALPTSLQKLKALVGEE